MRFSALLISVALLATYLPNHGTADGAQTTSTPTSLTSAHGLTEFERSLISMLALGPTDGGVVQQPTSPSASSGSSTSSGSTDTSPRNQLFHDAMERMRSQVLFPPVAETVVLDSQGGVAGPNGTVPFPIRRPKVGSFLIETPFQYICTKFLGVVVPLQRPTKKYRCWQPEIMTPDAAEEILLDVIPTVKDWITRTLTLRPDEPLFGRNRTDPLRVDRRYGTCPDHLPNIPAAHFKDQGPGPFRGIPEVQQWKKLFNVPDSADDPYDFVTPQVAAENIFTVGSAGENFDIILYVTNAFTLHGGIDIVPCQFHPDTNRPTIINLNVGPEFVSKIVAAKKDLGPLFYEKQSSARITMHQRLRHELGHCFAMQRWYYDLNETYYTEIPRQTVSSNIESVWVTPNRLKKWQVVQLRNASHLSADPFSTQFVTSPVRTAVAQQFGCGDSSIGAPLTSEAFGRTRDFLSIVNSHTDNRYFEHDFLSLYSDGVGLRMSNLSFSILQATGWFHVDTSYTYVDHNAFGFQSGCTFLNRLCNDSSWLRLPVGSRWVDLDSSNGTNTNATNSSSAPRGLDLRTATEPIFESLLSNISVRRNEYCFDPDERLCSSDHRKIGQCAIASYTGPLPEPYRYFKDPSRGGFSSYSDYCPSYQHYVHICTGQTAADYNNYCFDSVELQDQLILPRGSVAGEWVNYSYMKRRSGRSECLKVVNCQQQSKNQSANSVDFSQYDVLLYRNGEVFRGSCREELSTEGSTTSRFDLPTVLLNGTLLACPRFETVCHSYFQRRTHIVPDTATMRSSLSLLQDLVEDTFHTLHMWIEGVAGTSSASARGGDVNGDLNFVFKKRPSTNHVVDPLQGGVEDAAFVVDNLTLRLNFTLARDNVVRFGALFNIALPQPAAATSPRLHCSLRNWVDTTETSSPSSSASTTPEVPLLGYSVNETHISAVFGPSPVNPTLSDSALPNGTSFEELLRFGTFSLAIPNCSFVVPVGPRSIPGGDLASSTLSGDPGTYPSLELFSLFPSAAAEFNVSTSSYQDAISTNLFDNLKNVTSSGGFFSDLADAATTFRAAVGDAFFLEPVAFRGNYNPATDDIPNTIARLFVINYTALNETTPVIRDSLSSTFTIPIVDSQSAKPIQLGPFIFNLSSALNLVPADTSSSPTAAKVSIETVVSSVTSSFLYTGDDNVTLRLDINITRAGAAIKIPPFQSLLFSEVAVGRIRDATDYGEVLDRPEWHDAGFVNNATQSRTAMTVRGSGSCVDLTTGGTMSYSIPVQVLWVSNTIVKDYLRGKHTDAQRRELSANPALLLRLPLGVQCTSLALELAGYRFRKVPHHNRGSAEWLSICFYGGRGSADCRHSTQDKSRRMMYHMTPTITAASVFGATFSRTEYPSPRTAASYAGNAGDVATDFWIDLRVPMKFLLLLNEDLYLQLDVDAGFYYRGEMLRHGSRTIQAEFTGCPNALGVSLADATWTHQRILIRVSNILFKYRCSTVNGQWSIRLRHLVKPIDVREGLRDQQPRNPVTFTLLRKQLFDETMGVVAKFSIPDTTVHGAAVCARCNYQGICLPGAQCHCFAGFGGATCGICGDNASSWRNEDSTPVVDPPPFQCLVSCPTAYAPGTNTSSYSGELSPRVRQWQRRCGLRGGFETFDPQSQCQCRCRANYSSTAPWEVCYLPTVTEEETRSATVTKSQVPTRTLRPGETAVPPTALPPPPTTDSPSTTAAPIPGTLPPPTPIPPPPRTPTASLPAPELITFLPTKFFVVPHGRKDIVKWSTGNSKNTSVNPLLRNSKTKAVQPDDFEFSLEELAAGVDLLVAIDEGEFVVSGFCNRSAEEMSPVFERATTSLLRSILTPPLRTLVGSNGSTMLFSNVTCYSTQLIAVHLNAISLSTPPMSAITLSLINFSPKYQSRYPSGAIETQKYTDVLRKVAADAIITLLDDEAYHVESYKAIWFRGDTVNVTIAEADLLGGAKALQFPIVGVLSVVALLMRDIFVFSEVQMFGLILYASRTSLNYPWLQSIRYDIDFIWLPGAEQLLNLVSSEFAASFLCSVAYLFTLPLIVLLTFVMLKEQKFPERPRLLIAKFRVLQISLVTVISLSITWGMCNGGRTWDAFTGGETRVQSVIIIGVNMFSITLFALATSKSQIAKGNAGGQPGDVTPWFPSSTNFEFFLREQSLVRRNMSSTSAGGGELDQRFTKWELRLLQFYPRFLAKPKKYVVAQSGYSYLQFYYHSLSKPMAFFFTFLRNSCFGYVFGIAHFSGGRFTPYGLPVIFNLLSIPLVALQFRRRPVHSIRSGLHFFIIMFICGTGGAPLNYDLAMHPSSSTNTNSTDNIVAATFDHVVQHPAYIFVGCVWLYAVAVVFCVLERIGESMMRRVEEKLMGEAQDGVFFEMSRYLLPSVDVLPVGPSTTNTSTSNTAQASQPSLLQESRSLGADEERDETEVPPSPLREAPRPYSQAPTSVLSARSPGGAASATTPTNTAAAGGGSSTAESTQALESSRADRQHQAMAQATLQDDLDAIFGSGGDVPDPLDDMSWNR